MIQALRDEIIIKPVFEERKGLIVIPQSAKKFKQYDGQVFGEVLSVGPKHKLETQAGDRIIFQRHEGKRFIYQGQVYFAVRQRWVLGRVN